MISILQTLQSVYNFIHVDTSVGFRKLMPMLELRHSLKLVSQGHSIHSCKPEVSNSPPSIGWIQKADLLAG